MNLEKIGSKEVGKKVVENPISGRTYEEVVFLREVIMPGVHDLSSPGGLVNSLLAHSEDVWAHLGELNGEAALIQRDRLKNYAGCLSTTAQVVKDEYKLG